MMLLAVMLALFAMDGAPAPATDSATPRCFGAASRDPRQRCVNPRLSLRVQPAPRKALRSPNAPCTRTTLAGRVHPCAFGARAEQATSTIALIGDSHASHWRGALTHVARVRRWRGLSITTCPLSKAVKRLGHPARRNCVRWKRAVFRWFHRHPEVRTVFVSQIASPKGVVVRPGQGVRAAEIAGYMRAWNALPSSVERIVVIRDTPHVPETTGGCIERTVRAGRAPGPACAIARSSAMKVDTAVIAARRTRSRRVRILDMTDFFCGPRRCYPVIGGVLVFKDGTHITPLYSTTLGPFLLRRL
jgi:hypothetical protein